MNVINILNSTTTANNLKATRRKNRIAQQKNSLIQIHTYINSIGAHHLNLLFSVLSFYFEHQQFIHLKKNKNTDHMRSMFWIGHLFDFDIAVQKRPNECGKIMRQFCRANRKSLFFLHKLIHYHRN